VKNDKQVMLGETESYVPLCRNCFTAYHSVEEIAVNRSSGFFPQSFIIHHLALFLHSGRQKSIIEYGNNIL